MRWWADVLSRGHVERALLPACRQRMKTSRARVPAPHEFRLDTVLVPVCMIACRVGGYLALLRTTWMSATAKPFSFYRHGRICLAALKNIHS
jgi:hypothetical protein